MPAHVLRAARIQQNHSKAADLESALPPWQAISHLNAGTLYSLGAMEEAGNKGFGVYAQHAPSDVHPRWAQTMRDSNENLRHGA